MADNTLSENPFASPLSSPYSPLHDTREMFVIGRDLIVRSGAVLPRRCVRTNVETPPEYERRKRLYWASPWIALLILANLLILLLVYFLIRKRCDLTYSESPQVIRRRRIKVLIASLLVFSSIVGLFYGLAADQLALVGMSGVLFLISLIGLLIVAQPTLRIVKHKDGQFWIRGCGDEFLRDLPTGST